MKKEKKFFDDSVEWKPRFPTLHQQFHINKLEDFVGHLRFPFAQHRQTVSDFLFLSKGKSTRSKGLDKYEFSANTFFFLPAYQISAHDLMSADAKGFYCHFDTEIFNRKFIKQDIFQDFSFLEFTGNPLVIIDDATKVHVSNILTRLEFEYNNNSKVNLAIISINLLALLHEVKQFSKKEKITKMPLSELHNSIRANPQGIFMKFDIFFLPTLSKLSSVRTPLKIKIINVSHIFNLNGFLNF